MYMAECIHCPMQFDPAKAGLEDHRGGVLTGWVLPPGSVAGPRHEHEVATCAQCRDRNVDPSDGMFCGQECRNRFVRQHGE